MNTQIYNPVGIYMFKVNNRNTRTRCKICSKLNNFEHISHLVSIVNFEQVNAGWEYPNAVSVRIWENTDQVKIRTPKFFTEC